MSFHQKTQNNSGKLYIIMQWKTQNVAANNELFTKHRDLLKLPLKKTKEKKN